MVDLSRIAYRVVVMDGDGNQYNITDYVRNLTDPFHFFILSIITVIKFDVFVYIPGRIENKYPYLTPIPS